MHKLALVAAVAATACFHDHARQAPAGGEPLENRPARGQPIACGASDDLDHPVLDPSPGRMRAHVSGALTVRDQRHWIGHDVPPYVPARSGTRELFLLDHADGGAFALYRDPYGAGSCESSGRANCEYEAAFFDASGKPKWHVDLARLMSRATDLEIGDIRLLDGVIYFNEACQSYAKDARNQCSSLVAVDPVKQKVLWQSRPLVSRSRFAVRGCYIVAGYGFTAEPDYVYLVDRSTGAVKQTIPVTSAPDLIQVSDRDHIDVHLYTGRVGRLELAHPREPAAQLSIGNSDPGMYGGAAYGGATYGGVGTVPQPQRPRTEIE